MDGDLILYNLSLIYKLNLYVLIFLYPILICNVTNWTWLKLSYVIVRMGKQYKEETQCEIIKIFLLTQYLSLTSKL
jgi:hypothetical protein